MRQSVGMRQVTTALNKVKQAKIDLFVSFGEDIDNFIDERTERGMRRFWGSMRTKQRIIRLFRLLGQLDEFLEEKRVCGVSELLELSVFSDFDDASFCFQRIESVTLENILD